MDESTPDSSSTLTDLACPASAAQTNAARSFKSDIFVSAPELKSTNFGHNSTLALIYDMPRSVNTT